MNWGPRKERKHLRSPSEQPRLPEGILAAPALPALGSSPTDDMASRFRQLGPRAWELLNLRRMRSWIPDESIPEFRRYHKLAKATPDLADEIFIGLDAETSRPLFVPRHVLNHHAYILGGTGSGKTSHALTQLLLQVGEPRPGVDQSQLPPILIIDCKREGDRYLRSLAEILARMRGSRLRFFSNDSDYESLVFDPMEEIRSSRDPIKFLETLLKALGVVYQQGYGPDFFTGEQRTQLMEILFDHRPTTFQDLISLIRNATRGPKGNKDARGLYSAMATLGKASHIHSGPRLTDREQLIDLQRFYHEREVLYVHLNTESLQLLSRDIGRLLLYSLMAVAERRAKAGEQRVQAYVAIDEFHTIAAGNIVDMLNQARSIGVSFFLAHQTSSALKTKDRDLYGTLFENCHFKQWLTLEDPRVADLITLIAARKREIRRGGATANSTGTAEARAKSWSERTGFSYSSFLSLGWFGRLYYDPRTSEDRSVGGTSTTSTKTGRTETDSWREEMVPGLTPEMITRVNDVNLLSLVHVKQEGDSCVTPTHGIPTLVQGLYPFTSDRAERMGRAPWPLRPGWYEREIDESKELRQKLFPTPGATEPRRKATSPDSPNRKRSEPRNNGEKRKLERKHRALVEALVSEALPQRMSVERFAASNRVTVKRVLEEVAKLAKELDIAVADKADMLSPGLVIKLRARLKSLDETKPKR